MRKAVNGNESISRSFEHGHADRHAFVSCWPFQAAAEDTIPISNPEDAPPPESSVAEPAFSMPLYAYWSFADLEPVDDIYTDLSVDLEGWLPTDTYIWFEGAAETLLPAVAGESLAFEAASFSEYAVKAALDLDAESLFELDVDGLAVTLAGPLPRSATATAEAVQPALYDQDVLCAADLSLYNYDASIQPMWGALDVTMRSEAIAAALLEGKTLRVLHIHENADGSETVTEVEDADFDGDAVNFTAESFSVYEIVIAPDPYSNGGGGIRLYADPDNTTNTRISITYASSVDIPFDYYGYIGLRVKDNRSGLEICPMGDADSFYFAIMKPMGTEDALTKVDTIDHEQYGITVKMVDFASSNSGNNNPMSTFLGTSAGSGSSTNPGLLSTNLDEDGYPTAHGGSLKTLYENGLGLRSVNHLFIENIYFSSGYYEYDSTQNFASFYRRDHRPV